METRLVLAGSREREILSYANERGILIDRGSLELLKEREDWRERFDEIAGEGNVFISKELVEKKMLKTKISLVEKEIQARQERPRGEKRTAAERFRVIREEEVAKRSPAADMNAFLDFFQGRFVELKTMLERHYPLSPRAIKDLRRVEKNAEIDLIGMVNRKWLTKNQHTAFELEDLDGTVIALIMRNDPNLLHEKNRLMIDDVVAVKASKINNELVVAKQVLWPDLSQRSVKKTKKDVRIAQLSDMHIGSRLFLEKSFEKFLDWINGRLEDSEDAEKVRYAVVTGDNVDGVGVYPQQFDELSIKSISKQYEVFSRLILQMPESIEVFVIPGQHDAVRWADPQPAIPKKMVPELYKAENVHLLGSPSWVEIEGFKTLLYHGSGLHDLFSSVSGLDYSRPHEAVIELLRKRDLMPAYGLKHTYVPEKRSQMLLREEPDLVFMGDLHHCSYAFYRGTIIINGGTWQSETDYQRKLGHVPTPGILPVLNLQTGKIKEYQFY